MLQEELLLSKNTVLLIVLAVLAGAVSGGTAGYMAAGKHKASAPTDNTMSSHIVNAASVREALLSRPEIVEEAFYALQAKRKTEAEQNSKNALTLLRDALFNDASDPVVGADGAPFVMVEFFDYNCSYCKLASKWLQTTLKENPGKIKIILKDFPILDGRSNGSRRASEAAWAARIQGRDKYTKFHFALMNARGGFDDARIDELARQSGLDIAKMRADMKANAPAFESLIKQNFALAQQLGIDGTPAFITGDTIISGANTDKLQTLLDEALAKAG